MTAVKPVDDDLMAVHLKLENTGITVYERPLEQAAITYPGEDPTPLDKDASAECSNFDRHPAHRRRPLPQWVLAVPAVRRRMPERLQLALEVVPTEAGGI